MTLPTSKFNKNDHVWFYNDWYGPKFLEGTINVVHRWQNGLGIFYLVHHINQDGTTSEYEVHENDIYFTKEDAGTAIFEENGTPVEPYAN